MSRFTEGKAKLQEELHKCRKGNIQIKRIKGSDRNDKITDERNSTSILFGAKFGNKINQTICVDVGA